MTLETGLALGSAAISVAGIIVGVLKVGRLIGQSETQIKADVQSVKSDVQSIGAKTTAEIAGLRASTTTDMSNLAAAQVSGMNRLEASTRETINHQNQIAAMRHEELGQRVRRVEDTLSKITKVVVFGETGGNG